MIKLTYDYVVGKRPGLLAQGNEDVRFKPESFLISIDQIKTIKSFKNKIIVTLIEDEYSNASFCLYADPTDPMIKELLSKFTD